MITRLTIKDILRGACILGLIAGVLAMLQGTAYVASYTTEAARHDFAQTLQANPSLGILYGDPANASSPRGYIIYRCLAFVMLIGSIWGLLTATRLFRGQEDDGRLEVLVSGKVTRVRAALRIMLGFLAAWIVALALCAILTTLTGQTKDVVISGQGAAFFAFAALAPAVFFFGVGAFTSQLAANRRKATIYGLLPLVVFYLLRSLAHILENPALQRWTPFGWVERASPIISSEPLWLLPVIGCAALLFGIACWIAAHRDLGESLIHGKATSAPRYALLKSPSQLALRLHGPVMAWWLLGTVALAALMTSIAKTAVDAVQDSGSLSGALTDLTGGSNSIILAFISMAIFFVTVLLMLMAANAFGAMRREEAKSYLDILLAQPVSRLRWLWGRLFVLSIGLVSTYLIASLVILIIAKQQGIALDGVSLIVNGLNIFGPISVITGVGVLLYGWRSRLAAPAMYTVLGWSFLVDMAGSVVDFPSGIASSSLLHHIALVPAAQPNWVTFCITFCAGLAFIAVGMHRFTRRDLETE